MRSTECHSCFDCATSIRLFIYAVKCLTDIFDFSLVHKQDSRNRVVRNSMYPDSCKISGFSAKFLSGFQCLDTLAWTSRRARGLKKLPPRQSPVKVSLSRLHTAKTSRDDTVYATLRYLVIWIHL